MCARHRTASTEIEGRILAAALQLLDQQGTEGLTVRGIAAEAGIAPMGIYSRFEGKNGVYEALWIEGFDRLAQQMVTAVPSSRDALDDLVACGARYRQFAKGNSSHYRLMFMSTHDEFTPSVTASLAAARPLQCLISLVERAQEQGVMVEDQSLNLAQAFWATVHGFVALELSNMVFAVDADHAFDTLLRAVVEGFRRGAPAP